MHRVDIINVTAPLKSERFYTVKPGDSLYNIALHFYGNHREASRIISANPNARGIRGGQLEAGTRLRIP